MGSTWTTEAGRSRMASEFYYVFASFAIQSLIECFVKLTASQIIVLLSAICSDTKSLVPKKFPLLFKTLKSQSLTQKGDNTGQSKLRRKAFSTACYATSNGVGPSGQLFVVGWEAGSSVARARVGLSMFSRCHSLSLQASSALFLNKLQRNYILTEEILPYLAKCAVAKKVSRPLCGRSSDPAAPSCPSTIACIKARQ